jgi:protein SCO1/2
MKARRAIIIAVVFVLIIVVAITLGNFKTYQFKGSLIDPPADAQDFELVDAGGNSFRLSDQLGKVVILFFGFTHCPDVCPTTMAEFKVIHTELGEDSRDVKFVFISIDPERDTPEKVDAYVSAFNPDFIGLTAGEEELEPIWKAYGVFSEKQSTEDDKMYTLMHSSIVYVIDKAGKWRSTFPFELGPLEMAADIAQLLEE